MGIEMANYITGNKQLDTVKHAQTTAEYMVARLVDLGIEHSFSVPGDFAFALDHALISNPELHNVINANELNASYAADGYARVKGAAILCTTYAVGELSALNGVMGSKAENVVVFHLVGTPVNTAVAKHKQIHHTLGDGVFGQFFNLSASATCVAALITPDNARREMNRVIREAFKFRQPAYLSISLDDGARPVTDTTPEDNYCGNSMSQTKQLQQAADLILTQLSQARKVVAIPSIKLDRFGLTQPALQLIEKLNIPFVIMPHDKAVIPQTHANYSGFYSGLLSDNGVSELVETADLILDLGGVFWSDFNTGGFSNNLALSKVLTLAPSFVENPANFISNVYLGELIELLLTKISPKNYVPQLAYDEFNPIPVSSTELTLKAFYSQFVGFVSAEDIVVIETGSSSLNMAKLPLPAQVKYHNQTLWGSIGWATPATLGVALAAPEKRAILVTGEGSHQLTLNEIGVMGRYAINPIIFCLNNNGFMVERALELDPNPEYDNIAQLNYAQLPQVFGCANWLTFKVSSESELATALVQARKHPHGVYIELITGTYDYGSTLDFFNTHLKAMYS